MDGTEKAIWFIKKNNHVERHMLAQKLFQVKKPPLVMRRNSQDNVKFIDFFFKFLVFISMCLCNKAKTRQLITVNT